ncbi:hypothetical protein GQ54DRAFT_125652 [Martensiomyces pterosporus]|nr:hypothetical protein GQ54DRAFT_125652 [Martensiomyces pterosporus]
MIDRAGVSHGIRRRYGASLRPEWLEQCAKHIENDLQRARDSSSNQRMHLEVQTRLVLEQLLHSDISDSCYPALDLDSTSGKVLSLPSHPGAFLQVQEIMDIGVSKYAMWEAVREKEDFEQRGIRPSYLPLMEDEESEASNVFTAAGTQQTHPSQTPSLDSSSPGERQPKIPHGMLKLTLTDGRATVSALELAPIAQLSVELPIGTKVLVSSGQFLEPTGTLSLAPTGIRVLGGAPEQYSASTLKARLSKLLQLDAR